MVDIVQPGVYLTLDTNNAGIAFLSYKLWTDTYSTTEIIVHTGAVKINDKWIGVNTKWFGVNTVDAKSLKTFIEDRKGDLDHVLLWDFSSASTKTDQFPSSEQQTKRSYLYLFYTTIFEFYKDFLTANPADKKNFFKGRTKGSAIETPPGLVLKALKTGFEILGVKSDSGTRFSAYKVTDIEPYVRTHKTIAERIFPTGDFNWGEKVTASLFLFNRPIFDDRFIIKAYKVAPRSAAMDQEEPALYDADIQQKFNAVTTIPASEADLMGKKEIELKTKDKEKYPGARNAKLIRVTAYGFRADTRSPVQIRVDGGFTPNATRDDRRKLAELPYNERMAQTDGQGKSKPVIASPDSFLDNLSHQATWGSDYSGYVSFAKNPKKTLTFVPKKENSTAWIYVVKCRDAIDVAESFHQPRYNENEISVAGGVEWEDIVGWRRIEYRHGYRWAERFFYLSTDIIKLPKSPTGFDPENKYKRVKDTLSTDPW
jgi:hypothetical protein